MLWAIPSVGRHTKKRTRSVLSLSRGQEAVVLFVVADCLHYVERVARQG